MGALPPDTRSRTVPGLATLLLLTVALPAAPADTVRTEAVRLRFSVPPAWIRVPAPSDERAAQWKLPRAPGDREDGELILFFFGRGKGGSAQENLERWQALFIQPDGRPSRDVSVVATRTVRGLRITSLDLAGTYKPPPPSDGPLPPPKRGQRMLAAIVEDDEGPWFFRALGPQATIAQAKPGIEAMLDSLAAHP